LWSSKLHTHETENRISGTVSTSSTNWMNTESDNADIEDLFEDSLTTIFGDVAVSHGEPGLAFTYKSQSIGYFDMNRY
jgi:pullulanase/glycogen debranching enzyme